MWAANIGPWKSPNIFDDKKLDDWVMQIDDRVLARYSESNAQCSLGRAINRVKSIVFGIPLERDDLFIYLYILYRSRGREVLHEDKEPCFVAKDDLPACFTRPLMLSKDKMK